MLLYVDWPMKDNCLPLLCSVKLFWTRFLFILPSCSSLQVFYMTVPACPHGHSGPIATQLVSASLLFFWLFIVDISFRWPFPQSVNFFFLPAVNVAAGTLLLPFGLLVLHSLNHSLTMPSYKCCTYFMRCTIKLWKKQHQWKKEYFIFSTSAKSKSENLGRAWNLSSKEKCCTTEAKH